MLKTFIGDWRPQESGSDTMLNSSNIMLNILLRSYLVFAELCLTQLRSYLLAGG